MLNAWLGLSWKREQLHLAPPPPRTWLPVDTNRDANYAAMVLKVKKEAIDLHGLQLSLAALLNTQPHGGEKKTSQRVL